MFLSVSSQAYLSGWAKTSVSSLAEQSQEWMQNFLLRYLYHLLWLKPHISLIPVFLWCWQVNKEQYPVQFHLCLSYRLPNTTPYIHKFHTSYHEVFRLLSTYLYKTRLVDKQPPVISYDFWTLQVSTWSGSMLSQWLLGSGCPAERLRQAGWVFWWRCEERCASLGRAFWSFSTVLTSYPCQGLLVILTLVPYPQPTAF